MAPSNKNKNKTSNSSVQIVPENMILYSPYSDELWDALRSAAQKYDVEGGSSSSYIFEDRDSQDLILVWGRDGFEGGFLHGYIAKSRRDVFSDESCVRIYRHPNSNSMALWALWKLVKSITDKYVPENRPEPEHTPLTIDI